MMLPTGPRDGPDRAMDRVDGSNDVILTFRDVQDTRWCQRDTTGAVKGCLQWIAPIARMTLSSRSSHSIDQSGSELQAPHAVTRDRRDPNIITSNCQSLGREERLLRGHTAV